MAARDSADPAKTRQALTAIADWLRDETRPAPDRNTLATVVLAEELGRSTFSGVAITVLTVALYFGWRAAPASQLALIDAGIMAAALTAVGAHGFIALRRI